MNESTQSGDSVEVTNVDTAAQALLARYEQQDAVSDEPSTTEDSLESETAAEAAPDSEEESTADENDAESEEAEARFETLSELAEATGMDNDEFLKSIRATVKVQGEQSEVNLADLIKGYQLESDYTRKNEAFLQKQKEWETQRESAQAKLTAEFQKAGHAFRAAQEQLTHEFHAIDWKQLEKDDPQEFLIKRQQFGERQALLDQEIQQASMQAQQLANEQHTESERQKAQYLQKQDELLLSAIPEWSDDSVRSTQAKEVGDYLRGQGFSPEEVANISDHRLVLLARKAMNGDKVASDVDLAKKKVKQAPKMVKPNARQSQSQANAKTLAKLKQKAFSTGRTEDIAAALLAKRGK